MSDDYSNEACALLRLPGEDVVAYSGHLQQSGGETVAAESSAFVYAPFNPEDAPMLNLTDQANPLSVRAQIALWESELPEHDWDETTKSDYTQHASQLLSTLNEGILKKVVLSRTVIRQKPRGFSALTCFDALCQTYPKATVHLVAIKGQEFWLGASPEQLIDFDGNTLRTVSLAGTQQIKDQPIQNLSWGEKEIEEQALVTRHIAQTLQATAGIQEIEERGPETVAAGRIAHLRTTFRAATKDDFNWESLLKNLHPTPAIAGFPADDALIAIEQYETHQRFYYGGFLGVAGKQHAKLFLNLRCLRLDKTKLQLFAGGGYTAASDVSAEWQETEAKAETLLSVIENLQNFESS